MERPRGLPENPAQGRRGVAGIVAAMPLPPMPSFRDNVVVASPNAHLRERDASLHSNLTIPATGPQTSAQVIAHTRDAMRLALRERETQGADATGFINDHTPGITIDLSRKNILKLPDEVVDIIKHDLERLALSHNYLHSFPARFSECSSLRYLNVRQNKIKDFPLPLCDLRCLEILDLGRNRLTILPPDIVKLSSLKVFALQKNQIAELPLCLADMPTLQVLKLDGNPLVFPPPEALQVQASTPPNEGFLRESEVTEVSLTAHIKRYLRQQLEGLNGGRSEGDTFEDSTSFETIRLPLKRVMSGRFPVKVNGTEVPGLRSPNSVIARPPPIPSRSHYRGLSQQNSANRRPGVLPLTISSANERVRSNSETLLQSAKSERDRSERSESRSRRMGIMSRKTSELGTLDETQAKNRFSHYRGLSHGSAMQANDGIMSATSPPNAADAASQRPVDARPLSNLPARRRETDNEVLEAARSVLHSISSMHNLIEKLLSLTRDGTDKRSSLEIVFYNANAHVEELELEMQKREEMHPDSQDASDENIKRAATTLLSAYSHVGTLVASNVDLFLEKADPRYIRTLITQLFNSIMELRVSFTPLTCQDGNGPAATGASMSTPTRAVMGDTAGARSQQDLVTPTADGPALMRGRSGTFVHNPSHLRVATDMTEMSLPYMDGTRRMAAMTTATPKSGESFTSTSTGRLGEFTEEDRMFESIFLSLQKSTELVMQTLPSLLNQFASSHREAATRGREDHVACWRALIAKCSITIQQTEILKAKLSSIKLKEPGIRTQFTFWALCSNYIEAWYDLIQRMKEFPNNLPMPLDTRIRLRPIQQTMKDTWELIVKSPWAHFAKQNCVPDSSMMSQYINGVTTPAPLPMTPQSAALGPAVQATVPSTPQSASFAAAFNGNVFERADALISSGGISMSSRTGTMTSNGAASVASFTSARSSQNDDTNSIVGPVPAPATPVAMAPATPVAPAPAPGQLTSLPFRPNYGNKPGSV